METPGPLTRTPRGRPRARAPLTRARVVETALRFVDAHGLDALSMRRLGAELGVEAMALYNHVGSKDELLDGIVELLWQEIEAAIDGEAAADWRDGIRALARSMRGVLLRHPRAAPLMVSRPVWPVPALRLFDRQLGVLRAGGFTPERAVEALRTVPTFALGYAILEVTFLALVPDAPVASPVHRARSIAAVLPPATPDHLVDVALALCDCDMDAVFDAGLATIVRGLEAGTGDDRGDGSHPA